MRGLLEADVAPADGFTFTDIFTEHWRYLALAAGVLLAGSLFFFCVCVRGPREYRRDKAAKDAAAEHSISSETRTAQYLKAAHMNPTMAQPDMGDALPAHTWRTHSHTSLSRDSAVSHGGAGAATVAPVAGVLPRDGASFTGAGCSKVTMSELIQMLLPGRERSSSSQSALQALYWDEPEGGDGSGALPGIYCPPRGASASQLPRRTLHASAPLSFVQASRSETGATFAAAAARARPASLSHDSAARPAPHTMSARLPPRGAADLSAARAPEPCTAADASGVRLPEHFAPESLAADSFAKQDWHTDGGERAGVASVPAAAEREGSLSAALETLDTRSVSVHLPDLTHEDAFGAPGPPAPPQATNPHHQRSRSAGFFAGPVGAAAASLRTGGGGSVRASSVRALAVEVGALEGADAPAVDERASTGSTWSAAKEYDKNPLYADVDAAEQ